MNRRVGAGMGWRISLVAAVVAIAGSAWGDVVYVDGTAPGANDGTSWENAYNFLQDALPAVGPVGARLEIRVAQGVYKPDQGLEVTPGDWEAAFELTGNIAVKGGYAGYGQPDPNARDIDLYKTILSGDLPGNDADVQDPCDLLYEPTRQDNSFHVLIASSADANTILDGFTITGGNANGEEHEQDSGGGIQMRWFMWEMPVIANCTFIKNSGLAGGGVYNSDGLRLTVTGCTFSENGAEWGGGIGNGGTVTLANCTFSKNYASWKAGGVANGEARGTLENCTFVGNRAEYGGAMYNGEGRATLTNCSVIGNSGVTGGAFYNSDGAVTMINCTVNRNWCSGRGGVVYVGSEDSATFMNCVVTGNFAPQGGVVYAGENSYVKLTNCTLTGNWAAANGGALYINEPDEATITNCILRGNRPEDIYYEAPGSATVITYSNVPGAPADRGNIDADPCFAEAGHWDQNGTPADPNDDSWIDGDYHLKSKVGRWYPSSRSWVKDDVMSLCIDAGEPESDWTAELWPNGRRINMGAYGGTAQASMSPNSIGNIADLDHDGFVYRLDLPYFAGQWLLARDLLAADLTRDGRVDFLDFAVFAANWECPPMPACAENPNPPDEAVSVSRMPVLSWTSDANARWHDVYFGTDSNGVFQGRQATTTFEPNTLGPNATYYWRIDEMNPAGITTGTVWSFRTTSTPAPASNPSPADGAIRVSTYTDLSWEAGAGTELHEVYFGTSSPGTFQGERTGTTFDPGPLSAQTTYYWRIDERNRSGSTIGCVWSFTTR